MIQAGLENVAAAREGSRLIVTYENRLYRYELRAVREVMSVVMRDLEVIAEVTLIPQNRKVPLAEITIPAEAYRAYTRGEISGNRFSAQIAVSLDTDNSWRAVGQEAPAATSPTSLWKPDLAVHPQFRGVFGDFDDPVQSQLNIAPELAATLWRGMRLTAQLIIPIQNELEPQGDSWRPGILSLNQTVRLPRNTFVSGTAGYFTNERYGVDLETRKYFANGRWALGANGGYTGSAVLLDGIWEHSGLDSFTFFVDAEYWITPFAVSIAATYGRFLFEDQGWRFDVVRHFGEFELGFFAIDTEAGFNGGFNFSLPLLPARALTVGPGRLRPAKTFPWEYRYRGFPNGGVRYSTGNELDGFLRSLRPDFVKRELARFGSL